MGVVGLHVLGGSQCWLTILGGGCGELSGDVCFCFPPAGSPFGCGGECFRVLGHLEIEGSSPETKLLTQSFKIISHRKFLNYSA